MKTLALLALLLAPTCFSVEPAKAKTECVTKCRTDSGGHLICKTRCD